MARLRASFRLPVNRAWRSRWFAPKKTFGAFLVEDQQIREYVKKRFVDAGLSKILIERYANRVRVSLFSARPGVIIGRKGQDVDRVRQDLEKMTKKEVYLEIKEVRVPDCDAQLVAGDRMRRAAGGRPEPANAHGLVEHAQFDRQRRDIETVVVLRVRDRAEDRLLEDLRRLLGRELDDLEGRRDRQTLAFTRERTALRRRHARIAGKCNHVHELTSYLPSSRARRAT